MITLLLAIVDAKYNGGFTALYLGSVVIDLAIIEGYFKRKKPAKEER